MTMPAFRTVTPVFPTWQVQSSGSAALAELERRVGLALLTYSNVHRGAGPYSQATTALYDRAKRIVLDAMGLEPAGHSVVFASPAGARQLSAQLDAACVGVLSSEALGLPLGLRALGIARRSLPDDAHFPSGGGTARLVSPRSAIWAEAPARLEAGTPAIINAFTMACALQMQKRFGRHALRMPAGERGSVERVLYDDTDAKRSGAKLREELRNSLIGRGNLVPAANGTRPYVHLDNAASTPAFAGVWQSVRRAWRQPEAIRPEIVREVRCLCAEFFGAPRQDYGLVFVSNTTEAINALASSLSSTRPEGARPVVLNSLLEHNSNELPWRDVPGGTVLRLSIDPEGFIDDTEFEHLLREYNLDRQHGEQRIGLVAISGASNVLGSYNDLEGIARTAHHYGAELLVDAAQLVAHRRIDMARTGIDWLAFSGHKAYAPFGTGVLIGRRKLLAKDPNRWEALNTSGEENVGGIAGLGKALLNLQRANLDEVDAEERRLTRRLLEGLAELPELELFGVTDPTSPRMLQRGGIVAFSMKRVPHNRVAEELAYQSGIGVRTGCHCAHLLIKELFGISCARAKLADLGISLFPEIVEAMLPGVVRVSLGIGNDDKDVTLLLDTLRSIAKAPRTRVDRYLASRHNATPFAASPGVNAGLDDWLEANLTEVYSCG